MPGPHSKRLLTWTTIVMGGVLLAIVVGIGMAIHGARASLQAEKNLHAT